MKLVMRLNPQKSRPLRVALIHIIDQYQCYSNNNITEFRLQNLVRSYFFDSENPKSCPGTGCLRLVVLVDDFTDSTSICQFEYNSETDDHNTDTFY